MLLGSFGKPDSAGREARRQGPAADAKALDVGSLNARIHDGKIQFADTVSFNVLEHHGLGDRPGEGQLREERVRLRASSPRPSTWGAARIERFPIVRGWIMKKLLFAHPPPPDVAAAWSKLSGVTIEGPRSS